MRQPIKILFMLFVPLFLCLPCSALIKGGLEYQIPIDYDKLSEEELAEKADFYYHLALISNGGEMTDALNLYAVLSRKNPNNILYKTKLGELYDITGRDKYAKGAFFEALGVNPSHPEPYFRLGEFYYRRGMYGKALKMYKKACENGYGEHYETLYKIGDIYEKFGDTREALKYLNAAEQISPGSELERKITKLECADKTNDTYYSNMRKN